MAYLRAIDGVLHENSASQRKHLSRPFCEPELGFCMEALRATYTIFHGWGASQICRFAYCICEPDLYARCKP